MKKSLLALLLVFGLTVAGVFAQEQDAQTNKYDGNLTYRNVVVYKVFDHKDVVIVMYAKHDKSMGQVMLPKSWLHENPRKLTYRELPVGLNPYMTVLEKDGEFYKVILNLPPVRSPDHVWTVAKPYIDIGDAASAETLELDF